MWKYKCKSQFFVLLGAFIVGFLLSMFVSGSDSFLATIEQTLPDAEEVVSVFQSNPFLVGISGGLGAAGIVNVFLLGNLIASYFAGGSFILLLVLFMFPGYAIAAGIMLVPVSAIVFLYGWISLVMGNRNMLRRANISGGDDEIVRIYLLHHTLDEQYKAIADETKKTIFKINLAYTLGLVAIFCALFFINNLWLSLIAIFVCMFAFQYLSRIRANAFASISNLLYQDCNPEACMSALIYYGKRKNHYKLPNRALAAQCLIYMNDPSLAQDVLISFPRSNPTNILAYWSLMGYCYYLLKDENGVARCKEELEKTKPAMGAMGMMVKSEEVNACENKIRLMQGDFNTCKKYYLDLLKRSNTRLQKADCDYYIALISFVQEDYVIARQYFENTIRNGNKLYFVANARHYLNKIDAAEQNFQTVSQLPTRES